MVSEPVEVDVKYLILIYHNPESRRIWASFSESEQAAGLAEYAALNEDLAASGELIASEALADPSLARHVRRDGDQAIAIDGPFAEAKEQLAGFYLVDCANDERAIEIAGRIPEADLGMIEVRPTMVYTAAEM